MADRNLFVPLAFRLDYRSLPFGSIMVARRRLHRVRVGFGGGWIITEQIRMVSVEGFRRHAADIQLSATELSDVRHALAQMLVV